MLTGYSLYSVNLKNDHITQKGIFIGHSATQRYVLNMQAAAQALFSST